MRHGRWEFREDIPESAANVDCALHAGGAVGVYNDAIVGLEAVLEDAVALLDIIEADGAGVAGGLGAGEGEGQQASEDGLGVRMER